MAATVKGLLFAAPAVVPAITPAEAAALAGKTLRDMGCSDVRNLGGFKDWVDSGGEIDPG